MEWKGDGYCDDMNNNDACDFDGRDCCGVNVNRRYCVECKCLSKSLTQTHYIDFLDFCHFCSICVSVLFTRRKL